MIEPTNPHWVGLVIGNSRLHWAVFEKHDLRVAWDTPHLSAQTITHLISNQLDFSHCPEAMPIETKADQTVSALLSRPSPELIVASVVPEKTLVWQLYPQTHLIKLHQVPLQGTYSTLGIDRALALWGAVVQSQSAALVIDAGTALTFTGADSAGHFVGGAILPGLQLQLRSLAHHTAALPDLLTQDFGTPPPRWATTTPDAMVSGIVYTVLAGIRDFSEAWLSQFPQGRIVMTGGDGAFLETQVKQQFPRLAARITRSPHLIFEGMQAVYTHQP